MPQEKPGDDSEKKFQEAVARGVAEELRRRDAAAYAAKLDDTQRAVCEVIAKRTAEEVVRSLQAAAATPESQEDQEPSYGGFFESAEHVAWRKRQEKSRASKATPFSSRK